MKRAGALGLAIVLTLALGATASQAAKAKKIASEVEISGLYIPPASSLYMVGDVHSRKPKCERKRDVTVFFDDGSGRETLASATTDRTGDWEIVPGPLSDGDYIAEVASKKITKGNKKIVCKADSSPPYIFESG
jgi:hypothetical protein